MLPRRRYCVTHILLDVDGTLVDFETAMWHALGRVAELISERTGTLVTPQHLQSLRNQVAVEPGWQGKPLLDIRVEAFRRVLAAAGEDDATVARELSDRFVATREETLVVYPDAAEALPVLHARGFTLVAATNGNVFLERQEIARYLAHVHRADDVGVGKPDPRFFALALERTGGRAETAVAVGDRIDNDVAPAQELGMAGILIDRRGAVDDPAIHRIERLTELLEVLELPE